MMLLSSLKKIFIYYSTMLIILLCVANAGTVGLVLEQEQLEELGELFVDAESLDEIRGWAEEKRLTKAQ